MLNVTATLDAMADEDEPELDEPAANENRTGAGGISGWSERVRRSFRPGPSTVATSDQARRAVNYLDQRERRIAVTATVFELALTLIVVIPYLTHHNKTSDLKTMSAVHVFLLEGIVLFLFLLTGTILKRRALFGFASLLVGFWLLQIKALSVLGIAYVGLGMWLVFKGLKNRPGSRSRRCTQTGYAAKSKRVTQEREGDHGPGGAEAEQAVHATKATAKDRAEKAGASQGRDSEALMVSWAPRCLPRLAAESKSCFRS